MVLYKLALLLKDKKKGDKDKIRKIQNFYKGTLMSDDQKRGYRAIKRVLRYEENMAMKYKGKKIAITTTVYGSNKNTKNVYNLLFTVEYESNKKKFKLTEKVNSILLDMDEIVDYIIDKIFSDEIVVNSIHVQMEKDSEIVVEIAYEKEYGFIWGLQDCINCIEFYKKVLKLDPNDKSTDIEKLAKSINPDDPNLIYDKAKECRQLIDKCANNIPLAPQI